MAQSAVPAVSNEEAKAHLVELSNPVYPALAKATKIQGTVKIEIVIRENGSVQQRKVVSGHPMLVPSALEAVQKWKYKPFSIAGNPAVVRTTVEVVFDLHLPEFDQKREDEYQKKYFHNYDEARAALARGDLATAEQKAEIALQACQQAGDEKWLSTAASLTLLGHIKYQQDKLSEAEELYKESLSLHESHQRPDEAEVGGALTNLALLYVKKKDIDQAQPLLLRSKTIYEKRIVDISMDEAKKHYGQQIALDSFLLANIAATKQQIDKVREYCRSAVDFGSRYSSNKDREAITTNCSPVLK